MGWLDGSVGWLGGAVGWLDGSVGWPDGAVVRPDGSVGWPLLHMEAGSDVTALVLMKCCNCTVIWGPRLTVESYRNFAVRIVHLLSADCGD